MECELRHWRLKIGQKKNEHPVKRLDLKRRDDLQFLTLTHYRLLSHSKAFRNNFLKQVIIGCI